MTKLQIKPSSGLVERGRNLVQWDGGALQPRLIGGVGLPCIGFAGLALAIHRDRGGLPWDITILQTLHRWGHPDLEQVAQILTQLGVIWGILPVALVVGTILVQRQAWRSLAYLIVTLISTVGLNWAAKALFQRQRPHLWAYTLRVSDYAFPSGHAMFSTALVMVLLILAWKTRWRWLVAIGGGLFVGMIGWTRVYLGVHYPSDVLAGWLLSTAWAIALGWLFQLPPFQPPVNPHPHPDPNPRQSLQP